MRSLDNKLLAAADGAVALLWRWLGWPRYIAIRLAFIGWVVTIGLDFVLSEQAPHWLFILLMLLIMTGRLFAEVNERRAPPALANQMILARRAQPANVLLRWFVVVWSVIGVATSATIPDPAEQVNGVLRSAFFAVSMILMDALIPTGPRKRWRLPKLRPAHQRTGDLA